MHRHGGQAHRDRRAHVRAAADRCEHEVGADRVVDPGVTVRGQRRTGGADGAYRGEVGDFPGDDARAFTRGQKTWARSQAGDADSFGEPPQGAQVGKFRAAVEQNHGRSGQQAGHEHVPHHPAGVRHPQKAVVGAQIEMEYQRLEVLQEDSAMALHDWFGPAGRTRGVQDPQRRVEGDPMEDGKLILRPRQEILPGDDSRQSGLVGPLDGVRGQIGNDDRRA